MPGWTTVDSGSAVDDATGIISVEERGGGNFFDSPITDGATITTTSRRLAIINEFFTKNIFFQFHNFY